MYLVPGPEGKSFFFREIPDVINKFKKSNAFQKLAEVFKKDEMSSEEIGRTGIQIFIKRYTFLYTFESDIFENIGHVRGRS